MAWSGSREAERQHREAVARGEWHKLFPEDT